MRGTLIVIPISGNVIERVYVGHPLLDELRGFLDGGYLEVVPFFNTVIVAGVVLNCVAFCDEDGKRKQLPPNLIADGLWQRALDRGGRRRHAGDVLVGPVLVVYGDREFMREL